MTKIQRIEAGADNTESDTHAGSSRQAFPDAGSTPAASTKS
jgi:hypothetical protein